MRILNAVAAIVLLLIVVATLNNPSGGALLPAFVIGAVWTGLAAGAPRALGMRPLVMLLSFTMAAVLLGAWFFWPKEPTAWSASEILAGGSARTAGLLVVALALFGPIFTSIRVERDRRRDRLNEREASITARHRSTLTSGRAHDI